MLLLDTNIIIYACENENNSLRDLIENSPSAVSIISKIEALGYHLLTSNEKALLEKLFAKIKIIGLNEEIASAAIELRQKKRVSLGDAIIAATALENNLILATHNVDDFKHITRLRLLDPMH